MSICADLYVWTAPTALVELRAMRFTSDLGAALVLDLPDGSSILVGGVDEHGEPTEPADDLPAFAQLLGDPSDHDTLQYEVTRSTLREVLSVIREWIAASRSPNH